MQVNANLDSDNVAVCHEAQHCQQPPVVIIGSGMAGYTLARELRKLNSELPIVMVCQDSGDSYAKPTLSNAFAQNKLADTIANADAKKMAETLNVTILNFQQVIQINIDEKMIVLRSLRNQEVEKTLTYRDLVLATGAHSRELPSLNIDQKMVFAVNHLDEYKAFQRRLTALMAQKAEITNAEPIRVAIIGAGLIGCEFANDLISQTSSENANKLRVAVFDKAQLPLAQQLPSQAGAMLQDALTCAGVEFYLGSDIDSVKADDNAAVTVSYAKDNEPKTFIADIVLVAIGLVANTQLAAAAHIEIATPEHIASSATHLPRTAQQGIKVDEFLKTSAEHVYAIGDCANVMGSYMPYVMPLMNQAKALAKTLADSNAPPTKVSYPAMPVAIKTPSLPLVVLPVSAQYGDEQVAWQTVPTADGVVMTAHPKGDADTLLGFVLAGKEAGKQRLSLAKQVADWLA